MKYAAWLPLVLAFALVACDRTDHAPASHERSAGSPEDGPSVDEPYPEVLDTTPDAAEEDAEQDGAQGGEGP